MNKLQNTCPTFAAVAWSDAEQIAAIQEEKAAAKVTKEHKQGNRY